MENKVCVKCGMQYPDHKMSCKSSVEEWRLPTAYEWLKRDESGVYSEMDICQAMVTFAKLHVEAAIKACIEDAPSGSSTDTVSYEDVVEALKDSYPLDKIK